MMSKKIRAVVVAAVCSLNILVAARAEIPTYQASWGLELPIRLPDSREVALTADSFVIDVKRGKKSAAGRNLDWLKLRSWQIFTQILAYLDDPTIEAGFQHHKRIKKFYDNYVIGIYDSSGNSVPVHRNYFERIPVPELRDDYISSVNPGEILYSVVIKNTHEISNIITVEKISYYEKILSAVINPNSSVNLEEVLSSGVSNTRAYSFAKTVGSSHAISIGASLGKKDNAEASAQYTFTMNNSLTRTFTTVRQVTSASSQTVSLSRTNAGTTPLVVGIYKPVDRYKQSVNWLGTGNAITGIVNMAYWARYMPLYFSSEKVDLIDEDDYCYLSFNSSYSYSSSDYIEISNR